MSVRTINFNITASGISPNVEQFGGVQGEHRVTELKFTLSDELKAALISAKPENGEVFYRFDAYNGADEFYPGEPTAFSDNAELLYPLEETVTRHAGLIKVHLVFTAVEYNGEGVMSTAQELYSFPALIRLRMLSGRTLYEREYQSMTTLSLSAKSDAQKAEEHKTAAQNAATAAEGSASGAKQSSDAAGEALEGIKKEIANFNSSIDQTYNPKSANAQSGKAVAEALRDKADKATTLAGYGITDGITSCDTSLLEELKTVVDGFSEDNNNKTSEAYWAPFILDKAVHGHAEYRNKSITAIKLNVVQAGTLSIGRIKTVDYTSQLFSEELILERVLLTVENTGVQTVELPAPLKVNDDEDLFIGYSTDTVKFRYGNTEKAVGFFFKANNGNSFINQTASLNISVYAITQVEFKEVSVYNGKRLSILGDSISTFDGYIPQENETWYPNQSVTAVDETWWNRTLNELGMTLDTNNSWSGSCVGYVRNGKPSAHSDSRIDNLGEPDVIIVWTGINDFVYAGTALGTYDGNTQLPEDADSMDFCSGYAVMLNKILTAYPDAQVWVCTLPATDFSAIGTDSTFPKKNNNGNTVLDYNKAIRSIADAFSVNVIELDMCGITWQNLTSFTDDKLHPNVSGHLKISNKVVQTLDPFIRNGV